MIKITRFLILCFIILITLTPVRAQPAGQSLSITHLEATAEESGDVRVSAVVSVLDQAGQPVTGLTAADLSVSENSQPVDSRALTVAAADMPLNLFLLINTGSLMAATGDNRVRAIDAAKDAAISFIEQLGPDDQIAVYEFNHRATRRQDLTYDHNLAIDQGVAPLDVREEQATCLNDALLQVVDQSATTAGTPQAIIVLTGAASSDGCGVTPVEDVLEAATTIGSAIPIFTVAFGETPDEDELLRLGQGSKGRTLLSNDSAALAENLAAILRQLKNQIQISYPSAGTPGLATIIVIENTAELSDRRQVLIPQPVEPTPTPVPHFSISLTVNQPGGEMLEIDVANPQNVDLTRTQLYVNDEPRATADKPPFDKFLLPINDLGSGTHIIRVEATDSNKVSASAQVELMLTIPPTPEPAPTPTPVSAAVPAAADTTDTTAASSLPVLPLALICIGAVLLLVLGGLIVYLLMSQSKQPAAAPQPLPPSAPVSAAAGTALPHDVDTDKTILEIPSRPGLPQTVPAVAVEATLVVISGEALVNQPEFSLRQHETKIGRKEAKNDIVIKDPEVSRLHATLTRQGQQFFIQDLDSTLGTQINGLKIQARSAVPLQDGDEIMFGPRVKFKFQLTSLVDEGKTIIDLNVSDLHSKFGDEDPFRTHYDD